MRYLYIEKRQKVDLKFEWPERAMRLKEEFEKAGSDYHIAYIDSFEILFENNAVTVKFDGEPLSNFTHIIFGGHQNDSTWDYRIKVITAETVKKHNETATEDKKIHLQNINYILNMPYYDKLHMALLCYQNDIPHLHTYYRNDGSYEANIAAYGGYPVITKHALGLNDRVTIDGKNKVKKNVFLVEDPSGWNQDRLATKKLRSFFLQEFSPSGEDYRIFVSKGKVVGGWKRISLDDSFMTVGGERKYVLYNSPAPEIVDICERASKAWGVDFMALDFIYKGDKPMVLEFSMHPGFKAYENKCEAGQDENSKEPINVAKTIIESF